MGRQAEKCSNISAMDTVNTDNISDTISVTDTLRNSRCIICGNPFKVARFGKLYCSTKCKQFGYNHKESINQTGKINGTGINAMPQTFYIDEFQFFDKRQKMLRRYKELTDKQTKWEIAESTVINCNNLRISVGSYTLDTYTSKELTDNEQSNLSNLETDIEDEIKSLNLKELSIEQWSFIKSLYPAIEGIPFCELAASFSRDFFSQLNLNPTNNNDISNVVIKNRYVNHCNLIATGVIKFEKKQSTNNDTSTNSI